MSEHFMGNRIPHMYPSMCGFQKQPLHPRHQQRMKQIQLLPPNGGQLSEEEQIDKNHDILPADVADQIEVHEYENVSDEDDENEFDNDELKSSKKKSKSKSGKNWKTCFFVIIKERNQYDSLKIFLTFQT